MPLSSVCDINAEQQQFYVTVVFCISDIVSLLFYKLLTGQIHKRLKSTSANYYKWWYSIHGNIGLHANVANVSSLLTLFWLTRKIWWTEKCVNKKKIFVWKLDQKRFEWMKFTESLKIRTTQWESQRDIHCNGFTQRGWNRCRSRWVCAGCRAVFYGAHHGSISHRGRFYVWMCVSLLTQFCI